jgi:hypothetical protein
MHWRKHLWSDIGTGALWGLFLAGCYAALWCSYALPHQ